MPHLRNFGVALGLSFCVACRIAVQDSNVTLPSFDDVFRRRQQFSAPHKPVVKI